jgi:1-deoxy-D-xylulose-5-phosphate synthase
MDIPEGRICGHRASKALSNALLDQIEQPGDLRKLPRHMLPRIADELREDLIDIVSETGGHLGAGLGVVELTLALHYALDTPRARLVWDVSHQCYPHKILTGRRSAMRKVRQAEGPSGFTCRSESEHDPFGAAHSSTAISAALGFATARDLAGLSHDVVAIVGDGAMSGGMAFEALNNAGAEGRRMIVILNDNNMSIAPPSGALVALLARLRAGMPDSGQRKAAMAETALPSFADEPTMFDQLGVRYAGPFDGHDIDELVEVISRAAAHQGGPLLIHVVTRKGHGYAPAMAATDCMHGVGPFDRETGKQKPSTSRAKSYTAVFADALSTLADRDPKIVAITAAMPGGTGLDKFASRHRARTFDVGIAEQHAVTFAGALACEGLKPFAAIYSTFLQRGYDQVVHDIAIQGLPVRFAIDRAGLVGADGVTHHGSFDIAYLGCLPKFVLMAPSDEIELARMVATAAGIDDAPSAFRYPRGDGIGLTVPDVPEALEIGRARVLREGSDVALICYGTPVWAAMAAAEMLDTSGIRSTVVDARFAKPLDEELIARVARHHEIVATVEEGSAGGFSALVMGCLSRNASSLPMERFLPLHLPDQFIEHDTQKAQLAAAGLSAEAIARRIMAVASRRSTRQVRNFLAAE